MEHEKILKKTIEAQKESIALLTTLLNNEKLKNANLSKLANAKPCED
jgi:hypothetical protein